MPFQFRAPASDCSVQIQSFVVVAPIGNMLDLVVVGALEREASGVRLSGLSGCGEYEVGLSVGGPRWLLRSACSASVIVPRIFDCLENGPVAICKRSPIPAITDTRATATINRPTMLPIIS
jgi:hypothetical protein